MDLSTISEDWLNTEFAAFSDIEFESNLNNSSSQRNNQVTLLSGDDTNALDPLIGGPTGPSLSLVGSLGNELHYHETPYNPSQGVEFPQLALMLGM